jgi:hypothetical protein
MLYRVSSEATIPPFVTRVLKAAKALAHSESLAEHITRATPEERASAAREVGVDLIWDSMIDPLVRNRRAPAQMPAPFLFEQIACL